MSSIEAHGYPLVFKAASDASWPDALSSSGVSVRTEVRALKGMQKEALVYYTPNRIVWRMVSDEGPYLNGTDLAPFPLAFYTAGMACSFVAELLRAAKAAGIVLSAVELTQDNYYTMEGSALRGDMTGGALPAELVVSVQAAASDEQIRALVDRAVKASPAQAYNAKVLKNVFSLSYNGQHIPVERVAAATATKRDPLGHFDRARPGEATPRKDVITKLAAAETVFDVEGGAGSSLQSEQKRTLHVRGIASVRSDGLLVCDVQLFKPIGSTFRFLCDDQQGEVAPPPLAYLSAGVGFCFMTQVGRYASIVKHKLNAYRIVQDTAFTVDRGESAAHPVDTHLFVELDEAAEAAQKTLSMSERTCFLHAAMRNEVPSTVRVQRIAATG